jgi:hypothetical protein
VIDSPRFPPPPATPLITFNKIGEFLQLDINIVLAQVVTEPQRQEHCAESSVHYIVMSYATAVFFNLGHAYSWGYTETFYVVFKIIKK